MDMNGEASKIARAYLDGLHQRLANRGLVTTLMYDFGWTELESIIRGLQDRAERAESERDAIVDRLTVDLEMCDVNYEDGDDQWGALKLDETDDVPVKSFATEQEAKDWLIAEAVKVHDAVKKNRADYEANRLTIRAEKRLID
jgi:hypothetical protein